MGRARVPARCGKRRGRGAGGARCDLSGRQDPCRGVVRGADRRPPLALCVPSSDNRRAGRGSLLPRPILILAAARVPRPTPIQRRNPLPRLRSAGGTSALHRRRRGHVFCGVGAECPPGQRGWRLQPLGRTAALHALAGRVRGLGTVRPGGGRGRTLQVRNPQPPRNHPAQERSLCLCNGTATPHRFGGLPGRCVRLGGRRLDG